MNRKPDLEASSTKTGMSMEPDVGPTLPANDFPAKMKISIFACIFCLLFGASAQETNTVTGTTSISTDNLVELLNLTVLKCRFTLPKKNEPGHGYGLEYWVEDWRRDSVSPVIFDEGVLGLGTGGESQVLVKFPDSHSPDFYISTYENSSWMTGRKLEFEDKGATSWHRLSKAALEVGKPLLIALRNDGEPHPGLFPAEGASLPDVFAFYRKHKTIQTVAFYIRIKEYPEKTGKGDAANP